MRSDSGVDGYNRIDFATISLDFEDEPPARENIIPCLIRVIPFVQENKSAFK